jgi:hypothetical protein
VSSQLAARSQAAAPSQAAASMQAAAPNQVVAPSRAVAPIASASAAASKDAAPSQPVAPGQPVAPSRVARPGQAVAVDESAAPSQCDAALLSKTDVSHMDQVGGQAHHGGADDREENAVTLVNVCKAAPRQVDHAASAADDRAAEDYDAAAAADDKVVKCDRGVTLSLAQEGASDRLALIADERALASVSLSRSRQSRKRRGAHAEDAEDHRRRKSARTAPPSTRPVTRARKRARTQHPCAVMHLAEADDGRGSDIWAANKQPRASLQQMSPSARSGCSSASSRQKVRQHASAAALLRAVARNANAQSD